MIHAIKIHWNEIQSQLILGSQNTKSKIFLQYVLHWILPTNTKLCIKLTANVMTTDAYISTVCNLLNGKQCCLPR